MSGLFLFAIPLAGLAAALLVLPLWRRKRSAATRADFDLAVFRDQLAEIDRDAERGLLDAGQAEAARLEVERRILARADEAERGTAPSPIGRKIVLAAAVGAPAAAVLVYLFLGAPNMPDFPFALRPDARESAAGASAEARLREQIPDLDAAVTRLEERLRREPDDARGWLMLGRSYIALEKYAEAAAAFARAHTLDRNPQTATEEAEALILENNRSVPPLALKILAEVLEQDPREPRARYYVGVAKAQAGDFKGAAQEWTDLIALSSADAEWTPMVREQVEAAAKELGVKPNSFAPSPAAQALLKGAPAGAREDSVLRPPAGGTALPAGQEEMILGMVERLAGRLKDNPDDAEGWRMLARSYEVLGETEKAKEALAKADALAKGAPPASPPRGGGDQGASIDARGDSPARVVSPPVAPAPAPAGGTALPAGQKDMILGMVERLAGRLKDNPDDAEGWRMLARSYEVLGETDKAKEARAKAEALSRK